ncbi:MAG: carboxypeptidase-like regulatory domain-containing protein [Eubacteriales bacterium]
MKNKKISFLAFIVITVFLFSALPPTPLSAARTVNGTLTGVVLNSTGKTVANTAVYVFQKQWEATDGFGTPCWTKYIAKTTTGKGGQYRFSLPAGEYRVWFVPDNLETYAMEAYPDAPYIALGDTVMVSSGKTTGRISVSLDKPGKITGYVEDTEGNPMGNVPISLCVQDICLVNSLEFVRTLDQGKIGYFELIGLKPFPWQLWVNIPFIQADPSQINEDNPYYKSDCKQFQMYAFNKYTWLPLSRTYEPIDLYYDGDPNTPADDVIKLETTGIVNLSGYVYNQNTNAAIDGLHIRAVVSTYDPDGNHNWEEVDGDFVTDASGHFVITGLTQYRGQLVLYTDGNTPGPQYYSEYFDDSNSEEGARMFEIRMGETIVMGSNSPGDGWLLAPAM